MPETDRRIPEKFRLSRGEIRFEIIVRVPRPSWGDKKYEIDESYEQRKSLQDLGYGRYPKRLPGM